MPLTSWATHVLQWDEQRGSEVARQSGTLKAISQFGLQAETRLHEVGIASNRRSAYCGEYVPGPCTHRPSHHESHSHPKPAKGRKEPTVEGGGDDWGEVVTR